MTGSCGFERHEEVAYLSNEERSRDRKAVASLVAHRERLLTFFAFPAEHWQHLRTTNPIESTFATVKLRQRVTKGAGSRAAGLAMAFKLMPAAQRNWRRLNAHELIPLMRAGIRFIDGKQQERRKDSTTNKQILKGAPVTELEHLLGHADPTVTLRRYAHWFQQAKSGGMAELARAVCGAAERTIRGVCKAVRLTRNVVRKS